MNFSLQCVAIGALILFSSLSVFALNSDCQPAIYYQSISGNYSDQLEIKNKDGFILHYVDFETLI